MLGLNSKKNRNKKGLALGSDALDKPGTLSTNSNSSTLGISITTAAPTSSSTSNRPQPIQVTGSSRSNRTSTASLSPAPSPLLPSSANSSLSSSTTTSRSRRSSYHNKLSDTIATLELGVEFKLDLRSEDLQVMTELGCGNGGTVTKCLHLPTKAIMAKKVVHIASSESTRKQILRELQIMHDCSSPFIVSFYGAYLADPHICMCMEFMDKGSLDNIYKKVGPIPAPILGEIAFAVVSGLTYLYEVHKIMHRDVKPSNILMNSKGEIKICDFGVSGELINSVADTFVGTSTYMSPERISGDPYTVKSDVWSLGITLIELALGRFPFSSDDSPDDDDEDDLLHLQQLSLSAEPSLLEEEGDDLDDDDDLGEETLSPVRPAKKDQSLQLAEKRRAERRSLRPPPSASSNKPRSRTSSSASAKRKSVAGVSLAGSGHQMSILELLQYIVNEPAPRLPRGKFAREVDEFVDATLRKEPIGWDGKKKVGGEKVLSRPTPKELLDYDWMKHTIEDTETDVEAFARSIP